MHVRTEIAQLQGVALHSLLCCVPVGCAVYGGMTVCIGGLLISSRHMHAGDQSFCQGIQVVIKSLQMHSVPDCAGPQRLHGCHMYRLSLGTR
jgi:hypothetical protein